SDDNRLVDRHKVRGHVDEFRDETGFFRHATPAAPQVVRERDFGTKRAKTVYDDHGARHRPEDVQDDLQVVLGAKNLRRDSPFFGAGTRATDPHFLQVQPRYVLNLVRGQPALDVGIKNGPAAVLRLLGVDGERQRGGGFTQFFQAGNADPGALLNAARDGVQ